MARRRGTRGGVLMSARKRRRRWRRLLVGGALVALIVLGLIGADAVRVWVESGNVTGSSTVEFVSTDVPTQTTTAAPALPARRRPVPAPAGAARAPRPVDPAILARVKSALERL